MPFSTLVRLVSVTVALIAIPLRAAEKIVLVAGGTEDAINIPAPRARLIEPFGASLDRAGNLFIIEMAGGRLLKVDSGGTLTQIAGQPTPGFAGDDGPARAAQFRGPHMLAVLPDDNVLVADTWNGRIRRINIATGRVSSLTGFTVPAERARANGPYCIALDSAGTHLYIADLRRVHALDLRTGQSRVIAGNGEKGVPADGAVATDTPLVDPRAVAADRHGNVYILERSGHALRVVAADGRIRTVVNASGKKGATGDGGDARQATMNGPKHLCIDRDDSVIIADAENHLIRRYIPSTGKIVRVAGNGRKGEAGVGGAPEDCELNRPHGVMVDREGRLYIVDSYNNRVLKIVR